MENEINEKLPSIIREAGKIASSFFAKNAAREYKEDNTIVTQADKAVQKYIVEELEKLDNSIPIIAEEDDLDTTTLNKSEYMWVIDPIDGTSQYANDLDNWVIAIGLLKNFNPCAGWVHQPTLRKLYYAPIGDEHAYLENNGKPTKLSKIQRNKDYNLTKKDTICVGSRTFSGYKLKTNYARVQCLGSLILHGIETLVGHSIATFSYDNKVWDICAVAEIANRTDIEIKYISGEKVDYKAVIMSKDKTLKDDMIIAHKNIFPIIREHLTKIGEIGKVKYVDKDGELADAACDILEGMDDMGNILMLTKQARWFKSKLEGNKVFSQRQKFLEGKIEKLAATYNYKIDSHLGYKIILTDDPMTAKSQNTESIKTLIKAGADVRYLPNYDNKYRMLIGNGKLFLSYADSDQENSVVNKGFIYNSANDSSESKALIDLFCEEYYKLFHSAKSLTLSDENEIIYSKSFLVRTANELKKTSIKDAVLVFLGVITGLVISLIL